MDNSIEALFLDLAQKTGTDFSGFDPISGYWEFKSDVSHLRSLLENLYMDNAFWCDFLQSISGEHKQTPLKCMVVHYHLESLTRGLKVHIACSETLDSDSENPVFPSVSDLWKAANWHERESAELFGIHFEGHPDLRKLLLPNDWQGFPLRKDYQSQESYHGLKIKYEK
jgi:NADH-quinone oxidoreductase subunit C